MNNLISGGIAALIFIAFVGGLAESIGAIPFIIIVTGVIIAMLTDFLQSVKAGFAGAKKGREDH